MDARQLEHFLAVANEQSFTRAAARLHVVQSAVSASIKALETEVGTALFIREPRRVVITAEGRLLIPRAYDVLGALQAADEVGQSLRGHVRGTITLGILQTPDTLDIGAVLARFAHRYPEVEVRVSTDPSGTDGLVDGLRRESYDLAQVMLPLPDATGLHLEEVFSGSYSLGVSPNHRLASARTCLLSDLAGERFADFPMGFSTRTTTDRAFGERGLQRSILLQTGDMALLTSFVRHGLGIAFLPTFVIAGDPSLTAVSVADLDQRWSAGLAVKAGHHLTVPVRALREELIAAGRRARTRLDFLEDPARRDLDGPVQTG